MGIAISCNNKKEQEKNATNAKNKSANFKPLSLKDTIGGEYHEYYASGKLKIKGILKNGKREGDWSFFYENGKLWSRGEYIDGKRNGLGSVYLESGVLKMEGNYVNDRQKGPWKFYNDQGKLVKEEILN